MNSELCWVNKLKLIGILAVILGHINNPLSPFIYSWHMPLFFMVSGFFIKSCGSYRELICKDFKRLMIPYLIFCIVSILIESLKRWLLNRDPLDYLDSFFAVFYWMDIKNLTGSYAFVLWFLPCLFFAKIIYYMITKRFSNFFLKTYIFILIFYISFYVDLPFGITNAMNSVLWVFIGTVLFKFVTFNSLCLNKNNIFIVLSGLMILSLIFITFNIPNLDMAYVKYQNVAANIFWAVFIIYSLMIILYNLPPSISIDTFIKWWASNTMILFISHPYTNNIAHIIVEKIGLGGWGWILKLFISLFLLCLILVAKGRFRSLWLFKYV